MKKPYILLYSSPNLGSPPGSPLVAPGLRQSMRFFYCVLAFFLVSCTSYCCASAWYWAVGQSGQSCDTVCVDRGTTCVALADGRMAHKLENREEFRALFGRNSGGGKLSPLTSGGFVYGHERLGLANFEGVPPVRCPVISNTQIRPRYTIATFRTP